MVGARKGFSLMSQCPADCTLSTCAILNVPSSPVFPLFSSLLHLPISGMLYDYAVKMTVFKTHQFGLERGSSVILSMLDVFQGPVHHVAELKVMSPQGMVH